jgi:hypothetical protein
MATRLPVFTTTISAEQASNAPANCTGAVELLPSKFDTDGRTTLWESYSNGSWHQELLKDLIQSPERPELFYLLKEVAVLNPEEVERSLSALAAFLEELEKKPETISSLSKWPNPPSSEDVTKALAESRMMQLVYDEDLPMLESFFSYLKSQVEALSVAKSQQRHLLYVHFD